MRSADLNQYRVSMYRRYVSYFVVDTDGIGSAHFNLLRASRYLFEPPTPAAPSGIRGCSPPRSRGVDTRRPESQLAHRGREDRHQAARKDFQAFVSNQRPAGVRSKGTSNACIAEGGPHLCDIFHIPVHVCASKARKPVSTLPECVSRVDKASYLRVPPLIAFRPKVGDLRQAPPDFAQRRKACCELCCALGNIRGCSTCDLFDSEGESFKSSSRSEIQMICGPSMSALVSIDPPASSTKSSTAAPLRRFEILSRLQSRLAAPPVSGRYFP